MLRCWGAQVPQTLLVMTPSIACSCLFKKKPGSEILFFPALENYIKTLLPISTASGRIGLGDVGDSKEAAPQEPTHIE